MEVEMASRPTTFVKVSGDEYLNPQFKTWLREQCSMSWVVICVGGGTQINNEFRRRGIPVDQHPTPLGREIRPFEHRQLARDILEKNKMDLEDALDAEGIHATVIIPVLDLGSVLCHVNGDQMVRSAYVTFTKLFVVTTPNRAEKKKSEFKGLPKVEVIAF